MMKINLLRQDQAKELLHDLKQQYKTLSREAQIVVTSALNPVRSK